MPEKNDYLIVTIEIESDQTKGTKALIEVGWKGDEYTPEKLLEQLGLMGGPFEEAIIMEEMRFESEADYLAEKERRDKHAKETARRMQEALEAERGPGAKVISLNGEGHANN